VAIPKREIKPIIAGILKLPLVKNNIKTPPISASGRLSKITTDCDTLRN
jgi:hypothetical protein